jgi:predicted Zn-dependent peptidase
MTPLHAKTETLHDALGGTVRRTVLPNGVRILTEPIPVMRSAAIGVWVGVGARDETPAQSGVSHFLEHLLFKGTEQRTAMDISSQIEAVGGETNAFTAKEYTCYYARILDADLPLAVDVMCDVVANSLLAPADVETERGVILEEIAMQDDEPGDEVHDLFTEAVYGDHPLGRRISGSTETIGALTRDEIDSFYRARYTAPSIVIAAAGNLSHDTVVAQVVAGLTGRRGFTGTASALPPRPASPLVVAQPARVALQDKDTEQAHVVLGGRGLARDDERRFALGVLNNVLGGGMSSRLFQEIREKRGLAYSVYSFTSMYADSGLFGVYAGCAPGKVDEVLAITRDELAKAAASGLTDAEVARGKGMLKGALVLGLEDTGSRMSRLGKGELLHPDLLAVDEILARVDAVSTEEVAAVAAELLTVRPSLAVIGPFDDRDFGSAVA